MVLLVLQYLNMPIVLVVDYVVWHFFIAPLEILKAWRNVFLYSVTYFSTLVLLRNLFSPWHRSEWNYSKTFDIGQFIETFISNIISRVLGAIVRICMIIFGIAGEICIFFAGIAVFIFWLLTPFLIAGGFFYGFTILF